MYLLYIFINSVSEKFIIAEVCRLSVLNASFVALQR
jgi:hypothetical protein